MNKSRSWRSVARVLAVVFCAAMLATALPQQAAAASLPVCGIAKWNYQGVSGGCTCHAAELVQATSGRSVPWAGNAGRWWDGAAQYGWKRDVDRPSPYVIAAFGGNPGHVGFVERVELVSRSASTASSREIISYRVERRFSWRNWRQLLTDFVVVPVYGTTVKTTTIETYRVHTSNQDYGKVGVRWSTWNAQRTVVARNGATVRDTWSTPRTGGARGLQGYIYPPGR